MQSSPFFCESETDLLPPAKPPQQWWSPWGLQAFLRGVLIFQVNACLRIDSCGVLALLQRQVPGGRRRRDSVVRQQRVAQQRPRCSHVASQPGACPCVLCCARQVIARNTCRRRTSRDTHDSEDIPQTVATELQVLPAKRAVGKTARCCRRPQTSAAPLLSSPL